MKVLDRVSFEEAKYLVDESKQIGAIVGKIIVSSKSNVELQGQ